MASSSCLTITIFVPELYEAKFGRTDAFHRGLLSLEKKQFATADHVISTNESYRDVAIRRGGK